ncbi:hypothetical protein [Terribacillus sp. JSM ZJ617]|uniref:hypothetical protein n=1 Tax=Terribacillus sp. JSM ZJ617 TaxID=3342119 RepID=UPI0035A89A38
MKKISLAICDNALLNIVRSEFGAVIEEVSISVIEERIDVSKVECDFLVTDERYVSVEDYMKLRFKNAACLIRSTQDNVLYEIKPGLLIFNDVKAFVTWIREHGSNVFEIANVEQQEVNDNENDYNPVEVSDPYPDIVDDSMSKMIEEEGKKLIQENSNTTFEEEEIDLLSERSLLIRRKAFNNGNWDRNKTIGIWSPLHRIGVTTLAVNFSIYLGMYNIPSAVIEGLTQKQLLKSMLMRYTKTPDNWNSFIQVLNHPEKHPSSVEWQFKGVHWLPLDDEDAKSTSWSKEHIKQYINTPKYFDVTIVDLPTGEMANHTLDTLEYLDEIWILVDGSYQQILAWKNYIKNTISTYNIDAKLIFMKDFPFVRSDDLAKQLGIPLLTAVPDLTEEIYKNYLDKKPLIEVQQVQNELNPIFHILASDLLGDDYAKNKKPGLFKRLQSFLQPSGS